MINIVLYTFSKKENSTKRPTGGTTFECTLKTQTSILSPVIRLRLEGNPHKYNYAYIPAFERYYYISDSMYVSGLWEIYLSDDAMASWKTEIGNTSAYILRSSADFNGNIIDGAYTSLADMLTTTATADSPIDEGVENGRFVISLITKNGGSTGPVAHYAMTAEQFRTFSDYLFEVTQYDMSEYTPGEGVIDNIVALALSDFFMKIGILFKSQFNPMQYVVNCRWYPFNVTGQAATIQPGWWYLPEQLTCDKIGNANLVGSLAERTINVPKHPQANDRGAYLNAAPYSKYVLSYHPFGEIPLDPMKLVGVDRLKIITKIDFVTGQARVEVRADGATYQPIAVQYAQVGVDIALAQNTFNATGIMSTGLSVIGNSVSQNWTGIAGDVINSVSLAFPDLAVTGSNGGMLGDTQLQTGLITLIAEFTYIADEDNDRIGRPLHEVRQINTLPGYLECQTGTIDIPAMEPEIKAIRTYLEGGFYYE